MKKQLFNVGNKVYITENLGLSIFRRSCRLLNYPQEKKISQVCKTKDGCYLYQVKGFHFSNREVGKVVFKSEEEALKKIKEMRCNRC